MEINRLWDNKEMTQKYIKIKNKSFNMKKDKYIHLDTCYFCKSKNIQEKKEFIVSKKGESIEINAFECQKCEQTFYSMNETERVRKILNRSFIERIKDHFKQPTPDVSIFKGKVL